MAMLNAPNDALAGALKHQHPMGPIVWEQTWNEQDAYYCQTTSLPPILWVVKETHPRSQAQHQAKPSKST